METREQLYNEYISRAAEIRRLSAPSLDNIDDADDYSRTLRDNFSRIGELAEENRIFLRKIFFPLIRSRDELSSEQITELMAFGNYLTKSEENTSIDIPVITMLSNRLFSDADRKQDINSRIRRLDSLIDTYSELMHMTMRIGSYPAICSYYRDMGTEISDSFFDLLEKDEFVKINDPECRRIVLTDARRSISFFSGLGSDCFLNEEQLGLLERMLGIAEDPFYRAEVPDLDWDDFIFRTLASYAATTDMYNVSGFSDEQLELICERTQQFMDLCKKNSGNPDISDGESLFFKLRYYRNLHLAGKLERGEYRRHITEIYRQKDPADYSHGMAYLNLAVPLEFICMLDKDDLSPDDRMFLSELYRDLISYAFRLPCGCIYPAMLEYYSHIINRFIEIPGAVSFKDTMLSLMAALHPPTYAHSLMVAQLAECMCGHLIRLRPECLIGILGTKTVGEINARKDEIISLAYNSALCHDFGKIMIIDTVFVYGRNLFDMEFDLIRTHPRMGYDLLSRYTSTKAYADAALGHHKWHDDSKGYPECFDSSLSPIKPIIDLVQCADCLDAATDSVGRNYKKGKTFDEFREELRAGSGTRYAPWLYDLLCDARVSEEIGHMLRESRQENYRNTYYLLRDMKDKNI